ncbi:alpha-1,4-glucan--maltose-1-phosphate maltosyltransferase [Nakamurella flava]|uniref:Alpha-1,4-glucan:maltose-1-phosphate maltosyltransferase n=1 Tax=Nakamurella flava TaxID=2576308 RepID=A0A4U6QJS4_9ACTN|nr:alpha-1,4-glucan--maltose-1-phosphate maltosyltransferase [Nakamurella flava]TKV60561.1 alpha-1,4-glucan--maltose-1-phosphate maltosyltransferase [Nakamurella flava]
MAGRIGLNELSPQIAGGYPAKAVVGQAITIGATVFREGHDAVAANVVWRPPADGTPGDGAPAGTGEQAPLVMLQREASWSTRYTATVVPDRMGMWTYQVEAWSDPLGTWHHAVEVKAAAGQSAEEMANDLETGALLLEQIVARPHQRYAGAITAAIDALRDTSRSVAERIGPALSPELWPVLTADPIRELITTSPVMEIWVDRKLAEFGSWYEFFPRSSGAEVDESGRPVRHGTFADSVLQLDRAQSMGFDIVYLPPIHPIGEVNRKGPNTPAEPGGTIHPQPWDVGSPWAIGSAAGGHDAVHPDLGTIDDFDTFVAAARDRGLEVALDLALQCAPDHPWVQSNPEWFTTRPDGSIAYAENPPKKYQDIYPLNFDNDPDGLYAEVLRVVNFWIDHGITVFRVDNPHTKPINFWEWLIGQVHRTHPEVIFLAEAFTKPAMMHELARLGYTQSYTYFTWRTEKQELTDYAVELVEASDYMRPNFFVNTPDILHASLQFGGPAMFAIRAVLAATLSPTWGVYSGYELFEHEAVKPGSEEYANSEKYALRPRDYGRALATGGSLEPLITRLNELRRAHPALQQMKGLWFHGISNDKLLCYSRRDEVSGDTVIVVVCLDSREQQWGQTDLDMPRLGLDWDDVVEVVDELSGETYHWGTRNTVGLNPNWRTAHVLRVVRR